MNRLPLSDQAPLNLDLVLTFGWGVASDWDEHFNIVRFSADLVRYEADGNRFMVGLLVDRETSWWANQFASEWVTHPRRFCLIGGLNDWIDGLVGDANHKVVTEFEAVEGNGLVVLHLSNSN